MEQDATRALISQLADDLGWLEEHCQRQAEFSAHAAQLRLAAALVRNCIGPFLDGQPAAPLHVAVVGGAGAGKSTVSNFLSGAPVAEANPQAGFTRHPIAYTNVNGPLSWAGHLGFLGPLQRLAQPSPSNVDADVYQVRQVAADESAIGLLGQFVIWDCPDMTTWAATGYVPRLLEVAALADIIVYVASDERYNDQVPTQFLYLFLQVGKPVVVCLMKMKEADAPALVAHFQREVLERLPRGIVSCLAIPYLTPEQRSDPGALAARYRIPLLNQIDVLGDPPTAARQRAVRWATQHLVANHEKLLSVARHDLAALQSWRSIVQTGQMEFDNRYRHEYLGGEKFSHFDEALVRLLDLLELPGVGRLFSNALWVLRTPYRMAKGWISKALVRPDAPIPPEQRVLDSALAAWVDLLRKEAARRAASHPVWAHVQKGFEIGLADQVRERFQQAFRTFQLGTSAEVDRTARAIYEELEKSPAVLNTLRGSKFAIDVVAIAGFVAAGGAIGWQDLILVPLAASITHQLVELLGQQYVENQREQARNRQQALVARDISAPLAEWLAAWPTTGGSVYERLQLALRRIPLAVKQLDMAVNQAPAAT